MRQLGKRRRLQADSDPEVVRRFARCAIDLEGDLDFNGRLLKGGPLLNAIALWWVAQPPDVRRAIAADGLTRLEAVLNDRPEPAAGGPPAGGGSPPGLIEVELFPEEPPAAKKSG